MGVYFLTHPVCICIRIFQLFSDTFILEQGLNPLATKDANTSTFTFLLHIIMTSFKWIRQTAFTNPSCASGDLNQAE